MYDAPSATENDMTNVQAIDIGEQSRKDQICFIKAKSPHLTSRDVEAYEAGFSAGYRAALADMKRHGALKFSA
jgi:hypothetical protein